MSVPVITTDPKDSLAGAGRALALDLSSLIAGTGLAHRIAGLIRSLADICRASSQSCRAVTAPRPVPSIGSHPTHESGRTGTVDPMLSGQVDYVIGVDTHRDTNTAAVVEAATGAVVDQLQCSTDAMGYKRVFAFVVKHAPRPWPLPRWRRCSCRGGCRRQ